MREDKSGPFVSFLTTAYQTEDYLPATIDSVLAQTSSSWELVVVDNGRSDAIAAVVQRYAHDPRIRLVRQDNRGYVGGVMAAAEIASGRFLSPLDSDDQLTTGYVATLERFVATHPGVDAVGCDAHLFTDSRDRPRGRGYLRSVGIPVPPADGARLTVDCVLQGSVPYYGAIISRRAWDAVGGYPASSPYVDESVDIWLRLAEQFEAWLLPDRLARYRVRLDSLSRHPQSVENFETALVNTFVKYAERSRSADHAQLVDRTVHRLHYHQALRRARWYLSRGQVRQARAETLEAFRHQKTLRVVMILVLFRLAPWLLVAMHPVKQRVTRWLGDHTPQLGTGWRVAPVKPSAVSGDGSSAAPPRTRTEGARRGRPPTSP